MARSRNEIDKEIMYKKIMPTSLRSMSEVTLQKPQRPPREVPPAPTMPESAPPWSGAPARPAETLLPTEVSISQKDSRATVLINIMERLVIQRMDAAFSKFKCCRCDRCKKDVAAIALNKLVPRYVVADPESITALEAIVDGQDVSTAIVQAIIQVRANPRH